MTGSDLMAFSRLLVVIWFEWDIDAFKSEEYTASISTQTLKALTVITVDIGSEFPMRRHGGVRHGRATAPVDEKVRRVCCLT